MHILLRAADSECVLLLHVDDVLCLVKQTYLNETLVPALRAEYKISLDVVCKEGDELTFLKRKHVMVSPKQLAIQSHPKHLETLFELLKIKRALMPKKAPGHSLLDEPDNSKELDAEYAKINVKADSELICMLATPVYVPAWMHTEQHFAVIQRSPWTSALHP